MGKKYYKEESIQAIADAIREKNGSSDTYKVGDMAGAILAVESAGVSIPSYHYVECGRVANLISQFKAEHPNNLCFGCVSDMHVFNGDATYEKPSKDAIDYAAFALENVGATAECDFVANLGDLCWENGIDTENAYAGAKYSSNAMKEAFERLEHYSIPGNHDKTDSTQKQFDLIGTYNTFDVYSTTKIRGFGYKDFISKKVRLIALNTNDYLNGSGGCAMSYEQKDFLMRALDLSAKADATDWQILILSHIPIDWNGGDYNFYTDLQAILKAYENGTTATITVNSSYALNEDPTTYPTYSNGSLIYNFSGKNDAKIIANIHGHVHNNKVGVLVNTNIKRLATPNSNPNLNKSESYPSNGDYSISTEEAAKIVKVIGTAKDTSATFYCIDLAKQVVYAYGYGADIDRAVSYADATLYSVTANLTHCTSSNTTSSIIEGESYSTVLTASAGAELSTVTVTMGGIDITSTSYTDGTINIGAVTGNVIITAIATIPLVTQTITPHIAPRSTWHNSLSNGALTLGNSNTECALGTSVANSHSYTDRQGEAFYLIPLASQYCKATLQYSATDGLAVQYEMQVVKYSNEIFSSVASTGKGQNTTITWTSGDDLYLLVSIEHTDGVTKWDWNSSGVTVIVTLSNQ